jgi:hypothetical protein
MVLSDALQLAGLTRTLATFVVFATVSYRIRCVFVLLAATFQEFSGIWLSYFNSISHGRNIENGGDGIRFWGVPMTDFNMGFCEFLP